MVARKWHEKEKGLLISFFLFLPVVRPVNDKPAIPPPVLVPPLGAGSTFVSLRHLSRMRRGAGDHEDKHGAPSRGMCGSHSPFCRNLHGREMGESFGCLS